MARYKKARGIEETVSSSLTGNAAEWTSPIAGTQTIEADPTGDANLPIQQHGNRATVFITEGIAGGDEQETFIIAEGDGGWPKVRVPVRFTGQATVPEGPTITSLVPGDGEVTINVTNGGNGGSAITHHRIYSGSSPDELVGGSLIAQASSHTVSAPNDTPFYAIVVAKNAVGEGADSNLAGPVTPEAPPIDPPDGVLEGDGYVNQIAATYTLTTEDQVGVTRTLKQTTHAGVTTNVGVVTFGVPIDISGTLGKRLWTSSTDGGTPVISSKSWILDQRNIDPPLKFTDYPDNSDFGQIEVNGVPGTWVRSTGTSGDTKILGGVWVQATKPSTAASYRHNSGMARQSFSGQVGVEGNDFSAWRHIRINLPASGVSTGEYVRLRIGASDWEISNTLALNGSVIGTQYQGYFVDTLSRNLVDGDYISCGPTYGADGTLYYQLWVNMIPLISANGYKGLIISDPTKQVGTEVQLSTHTLNNGVSRTLPWNWYHSVEIRGHANTVFALKTGAVTAPTIDTLPRVTFEAFYSGTRTTFVAALFNKVTGQMLSDFETFSTSGSGLTGEHYLEFDPVEGGGENVGIVAFDPSNPSSTLSTMSCGYLQYYAAVPEVQYIGVNLQARGEVDYFTDRFKYGFHLWCYVTGAGAELSTTTYPLDTDPTTGLIAGTISAAAAARVPPATQFSMYLIHPAPANSSDAGGSWKATTNLNPTYWQVSIGSSAFGVSSASVNPANNDVTWTAQAGQVGQLKIIVTPKAGYLSNLPSGGFYFETGPVGADFSKLMNQRYVADFGSATGRKMFRLMQMAGATDAFLRDTQKATFPFINYPAPVDGPEKISRMAAEMNQMPWFCMAALASNERMVEWAIEWARRLKAYDADGGISAGLKWAGPFAFELGNEVWNSADPYGEAFKAMIPLSGEAGFIPGVTTKPILDHITQTYIKWQGGGNYLVTHAAIAPGVAVYGYFQGGEKALIYNSTASTIPSGTTLPTNFNLGTTTNGLTVAANDSTMKGFCRDWMVWMLGVVGDCMRYGLVPPAKGAMPQRLDLQDETVALGHDRIKMVFATWQAHSAESVADDLLAGGTGTEYVRKIDGVGPSFYANVERSVPNPATQAWQIAIEAATNDTQYANDAWPAFQTYLDSLVYGANGTLDSIQAQYNGVFTLLRRAGIPADQCPKLWLYEGGVHFNVLCAGGVTQSTKYHNFNTWLTGSTQYRNWTNDMVEAVRQLAPEAMASFVDVERPSPPTDGGWQDFGIISYPGSGTVQTESRWLGENDMLDGIP